MKKIIFIALIVFGMSAKAQITLEHVYDSASTMNAYYTEQNQLMIVNFEVSGERYVKINRAGKSICIYDMNHTLLKTISLAGFPMNGNGEMGDVLYLSENLFDTDARIEFLYTFTSGYPHTIGNTKIIKEDGSVIFSDTGAVAVHPNWEMQQWPIYNTSVGTKMILSYSNRQAKVFNLPGILTTSINATNNELLTTSNLKLSNPYPNPSSTSTKIDYTLPEGISQGEIVFYNLQGAEIKRFKVDKTFNNLLVSTADIKAGTYYYQLQTATENSGGKKMVVIK